MSEWQTLLRSRFQREKLESRGVSRITSIYDIPDAMKTVDDTTANKTKFEFRYVDGVEPLRSVLVNDGILLFLGKQTGRVFKIERPRSIPNQSFLKVLFSDLSKDTDKGKTDRDNYAVIVKALRDQDLSSTAAPSR